ncbi:hypothetical protein ACFZDP_45125 [Streptomyces mirabilis]|uniref:hypothetical protein n=1 Tax=Streptomyces mirabilis TaxID=68239 RepID=UPI0036E44B1A
MPEAPAPAVNASLGADWTLHDLRSPIQAVSATTDRAGGQFRYGLGQGDGNGLTAPLFLPAVNGTRAGRRRGVTK